MPNTSNKYLIIIAGPTAVGKTSLAIRIAMALKAEIISADSRQFFKELNVGTAKPSEEELALVPHYFINSHSIAESYSAGDFERDALQLLEELFRKSNYVIMAGGSGFYVKAVLEGLDDLPAPLPGLRESLTERLEKEGLTTLQAEIARADPDFAGTREWQNPQRVVRALEVFMTSGIPISRFQQKMKKERPFQPIMIGLDRDRQELYSRIDERMDLMLENGLVQEARDLIAYRAHHALQTVGYKEVYGFLDGQYNEPEMVRLLKQNSRRYAKRQLTWFRHQAIFQWFHPDNFEGILDYILEKTKGNRT
ncbi:tRNA dimethylallyltransferase [Dyadobacter sp. CECT 9275]|uniref:tRNA dimethylallyltransferase n=1 Tax=Dyadobacter helix TaxID=2822344 RepID=A0A916ND01_9BACT|nr:tRNA (adenosine(37)-N6)-dimethylallyltransferase MiaA [Dyadobacter sp. CECT 9275]CAG5005134.1 tRNA dimethylallyltransferase [Dyadobacter sp. CECT 9275]